METTDKGIVESTTTTTTTTTTTNTTTFEKENECVIHQFTTCRGCGMSPITGVRYKCGNCTSYDLCESCEDKDLPHDDTHLFLKLKEAVPFDPIIPVLQKNYYKEPEKKRGKSQFNIPKELHGSGIISVDLLPRAKEVLQFLEIIDANTKLGDKDVLKKVKVKYLKYLNLVHKHSDKVLHPSEDIEAYWVSHIIRPEDYRLDCIEYFGEIVPHHVEIMECMKTKGRIHVEELWKEEYGENEDEGGNHDSLPDSLKLAYEKLRCSEDDVIEDRAWLSYFRMYVREVTDFDTFLVSALEGYKKFLTVCSAAFRDPEKYKGHTGMLEPSYGMDLFWHTHMLHPIEYYDDCKKMAGQLLIHVPWPKDTTVNQMFDDLDSMDILFKETFGEGVHAALEQSVAS